MGEKAEEQKKKKRRTMDSLGWLTEASIMKKVKPIEGVGASSIMEIKAELYRSQEESNESRDLADPDVEYQRAKKIVSVGDHFSRRNSGVEARPLKISSPVSNTPNWCPR